MTAAVAAQISREMQARRLRWRVVAVGGMIMALAGILAGAADLSAVVPLPTWGLGAAALAGLLLMTGAGLRLLALRNGTRVEKSGPAETGKAVESWTAMSTAFEGLRTGAIPILMPPESAVSNEREAFERGNEAFQFLARRQKVVRAAIDELREELNIYHRYLTKSQVGLIGANSVAERLEDLDKRLAKIRSVV